MKGDTMGAAFLGAVLLTACNGLTDVERFRACPECIDGGGAVDASGDAGDTNGATSDVPEDASARSDVRIDVIDPDDAAICESGAKCDDHDACTANVCTDDGGGCEFPLVLDMDEDKHVSVSTGLACADDCDDGNADVFPGQTAWFDAPKDVAGFDYDCNGRLDKRWTIVASCSTSPSCAVTEGWLDAVPECGFVGEWVVSCASSGATCTPATATRRTQECH
jgi:hypothetical protein